MNETAPTNEVIILVLSTLGTSNTHYLSYNRSPVFDFMINNHGCHNSKSLIPLPTSIPTQVLTYSSYTLFSFYKRPQCHSLLSLVCSFGRISKPYLLGL
ncbi:hypothetical protein PDJAM_G00132840, partial [Pangasius djambal]|nr:hypothetical protein [Pangasius djambal]